MRLPVCPWVMGLLWLAACAKKPPVEAPAESAEAPAEASGAAAEEVPVEAPASTGPATPIPPAGAAGAIAAIEQAATSEARGASPSASVHAGQFAEGQTLAIPVELAAGACYTIIAAGDGLDEIDVQLLLSLPPLPRTVVARGRANGAVAIIGGAEGCWHVPGPGGSGEIVVQAIRGAGIAAVRVYQQ